MLYQDNPKLQFTTSMEPGKDSTFLESGHLLAAMLSRRVREQTICETARKKQTTCGAARKKQTI